MFEKKAFNLSSNCYSLYWILQLLINPIHQISTEELTDWITCNNCKGWWHTCFIDVNNDPVLCLMWTLWTLKGTIFFLSLILVSQQYLLWKILLIFKTMIYLVYFAFVYLEIYQIQYFHTAFLGDVFRIFKHLRGSSFWHKLTDFIRNSIPDAAGVLDPFLILIQKKLISYILRQFGSLRIAESHVSGASLRRALLKTWA